jgi:hypothetical protein
MTDDGPDDALLRCARALLDALDDVEEYARAADRALAEAGA